MNSENKNSECKEFNNLKYRTMINTGTNLENNVDTSEDTINNFLNMDIESNKKGMWSKLTKTEKIGITFAASSALLLLLAFV